MKMGQTKMAGSVGNVINVVDLLKKHHPETVRFLLLGTHYRSPIEYSEDRLGEVRRSLDGFYRFFERFERITHGSFYQLEAPVRQAALEIGEGPFSKEIGRLRGTFLDNMSDDFNTGGAIGVLHELLTALNRFADEKQLEGGAAAGASVEEFTRGTRVFRELSRILGLFGAPTATANTGGDQLVNGLMQLLLDLRAEARKTKNFALSDQIRKRLSEIGVTLEDRQGGTGWRLS